MAQKGPRRHQKRLSSPATQNLAVKDYTFTYAQRPGTHAKKESMPLGIVLRDKLGVTHTQKETRWSLNDGHVKVDGVVRKSPHFNVGLFDIVTIADKENYRVLLDTKGRLTVVPLKTNGVKVGKVKGKKAIGGGLIALSLHDGRSIHVQKTDVNVGDSVVVKVPENTIEQTLPLKTGQLVLLLGGNHVGQTAVVEEMTQKAWRKPQLLTLKSKNETYQTTIKNVVVIGSGKSTLQEVEA